MYRFSECRLQSYSLPLRVICQLSKTLGLASSPNMKLVQVWPSVRTVQSHTSLILCTFHAHYASYYVLLQQPATKCMKYFVYSPHQEAPCHPASNYRLIPLIQRRKPDFHVSKHTSRIQNKVNTMQVYNVKVMKRDNLKSVDGNYNNSFALLPIQ